MKNLDSRRCWRCTLCPCKVRNQFLANFWNRAILLCIPCISYAEWYQSDMSDTRTSYSEWSERRRWYVAITFQLFCRIYHLVQNLLIFCLLSENTKLTIQRTIILSYIIRMIKWRNTIRIENVACKGKKECMQDFVGKLEGRRPLGIFRHRGRDNWKK